MDDTVLSRRDVHRAVTDKIVEAIEAGANDYEMPWHRSVTRPINAVTEKPYHGVNVVALWCTAASRGFRSGHWATYRQWQSVGAQVRKGERGAVVVFYKPIEQEQMEDEDEAGKTTDRPKLIARASWAFNAEQVDGWTVPTQELPNQVQIREHVEAFIAATHAEIRHGGDMACYNHTTDVIEVPHPEQFFGTKASSATEAYYSVVLHEIGRTSTVLLGKKLHRLSQAELSLQARRRTCDRVWPAWRRASKGVRGSNCEAESTDALGRGGLPRSSVEAA